MQLWSCKFDGTARTGNVGTGSIFKIKKNIKLQINIPGDPWGYNGDGVINIVDLANIQNIF